MSDNLWIVCSEIFQWDGKQHHCAVANGVFTSKEKAHAFIDELKIKYNGVTDAVDIKVFGPIIADIGHTMLKNDDKVYDGEKWVKPSTVKARRSKKLKDKTGSIGPADRPIDMDFVDFGEL